MFNICERTKVIAKTCFDKKKLISNEILIFYKFFTNDKQFFDNITIEKNKTFYFFHEFNIDIF